MRYEVSSAFDTVDANGLPSARAQDRPISAYSVDQTGAKIESGGFHGGLERLAYHGLRFWTTKNAGIAPVATVPPIHAVVVNAPAAIGEGARADAIGCNAGALK